MRSRVDAAVSLDDLRLAAKRRLPRIAYDFIEGGVEDEHALARNRDVYRRYTLLPRYLTGVAAPDQSRSLFGRSYTSPFGICPMGLSGLWRDGTDLALAAAAADARIPFVLSTSSNASIEAAHRLAPDTTWFQLYGSRDRSITARLIARVRDLGVETLVLTVDVPAAPRRERNLRNGFTRPLRFRPSIVLDGLRHPVWLRGFLKHRIPMMENWAPYAEPGANADVVGDVFAANTPNPTQTWAVFDDIRRAWPGRLVVKGILHPDDARRAVAGGADGLIVSNHGGRQLDRAPSAVELLPAVRAAVGPEVTVAVDGGVTRGTDILVALCLGADFAFVGRSILYGAVAGGRSGADKAISILRQEISTNLVQIGVASLDELGPHSLGPCPVDPHAVDQTGPYPAAPPRMAS